MKKHTGDSYDDKARRYAESVDTRPWNAHYERPAVVSLLLALKNQNVLDAGCGSGWYAEYLLKHGANVVAFDFNAEFVQLARARVGDRAKVLRADLAEPLDFARAHEFDLVVCPLVLHYLKDWLPALREFHRVLKPRGVLVFSTHHPFQDWQYFKTEDYFAVDLVEDEWNIGKVKFYRRPLTAMSRDLASAGFDIERILEPQPTEDFKRADPKGYEYHIKHPLFLVIRARKR
ncbi:MAG TPA: class I SAM-dependent methyltransferase [Verrucomicrobiae bacterium]|nr:class I SAM-dependent methyltransferase [Verrucomicrobiae bacterium]